MCGIVGFLDINNKQSNFDPIFTIRQMITQIKSRGPDFQDYWYDPKKKVFLGHSRLAIIDLNIRSNQPIHSKNKRWTIIFNGEIYNFKELKNTLSNKEELNGDTSVLVSLIEKYGFEKTTKLIDGMFAIAAWDNKEDKLFLTRDRMGEKPLYYSIENDYLIFGSNLNSVSIFPKNNLKISQKAISSYFKFNYISSSNSIYQNIFKLLPGKFLEYDLKLKISKIKTYWELNQKIKNENNENILSETENIISNTVEKQLVSDVDIGTFLSGGIDSSLITAITKKFRTKSMKTFTLSSGDYNFDESKRAKKIADYLGYENLSFSPSKKDIISTVSDLPEIYGEPFGDSSQIPTILISKFAKKYVKVVLSGDGGDEMFGGYNRYKFFYSIYPKLKYVPNFFLKKIGYFIKNLDPRKIDFFFKNLNYLLPDSKKKYNYGYLINKFGRLIGCENYEDSFYTLISNDLSTNKILINECENFSNIKIDNIENIVKHDLQNYLPDDILCKVDRASMAYGLEVRAPFVDRNVVEHSQKIPFKYKIHNGESKFILKRILEKYLSKSLYEGQKRGFSVPISAWLRNDLKEMLMDYSRKPIIFNQNIFNYNAINKTIEDHMLNKKNNDKLLWSFLVFQVWYFQNK